MSKKSVITFTNGNWFDRFRLRGYRGRGTPKFPSFWNYTNVNHNIKVCITIEELPQERGQK